MTLDRGAAFVFGSVVAAAIGGATWSAASWPVILAVTFGSGFVAMCLYALAFPRSSRC